MHFLSLTKNSLSTIPYLEGAIPHPAGAVALLQPHLLPLSLPSAIWLL